jgi:hypothetical protein
MLDAYHFRYDVQQKHVSKEGSLRVKGEVANGVHSDTTLCNQSVHSAEDMEVNRAYLAIT